MSIAIAIVIVAVLLYLMIKGASAQLMQPNQEAVNQAQATAKQANELRQFMQNEGERMMALNEIDPPPLAHDISLEQRTKLLSHVSKAFHFYCTRQYGQVVVAVLAPIQVIDRRMTQFAAAELINPQADMELAVLLSIAYTMGMIAKAQQEAAERQKHAREAIDLLQELELTIQGSTARTLQHVEEEKAVALYRLCECVNHAARYELCVLLGDSGAAAQELAAAVTYDDTGTLLSERSTPIGVWQSLAAEILRGLEHELFASKPQAPSAPHANATSPKTRGAAPAPSNGSAAQQQPTTAPPPTSYPSQKPTSDKSFEVIMPKLGQGMEAGTVLNWRVADGQYVRVGTVLAEIETDKSNVEIEAEDAGQIRILVAAGARVPVGEPIGCIVGNA